MNDPGFNGGELIYCKKCRKPLRPGAAFCGSCGAKAFEVPQATAPQAPATEQPPVAAYTQPAAPLPAAAYPQPFYPQQTAYEAAPLLPRTDLKPWAVALVSGVCAFAVVTIAFLVYLEVSVGWPF